MNHLIKHFKDIAIFAIVLFVVMIFSLGSANAAGAFSVTDHVIGTPAQMTAQTSLLQGASDHNVFLATGVCSIPKKDLQINGMTILSFGSLCAYGSGQITGQAAAFAPDVTTGGTILDVPFSHWDIGYQVASTSTDPTASKAQVIFGIGVMVPLQ